MDQGGFDKELAKLLVKRKHLLRDAKDFDELSELKAVKELTRSTLEGEYDLLHAHAVRRQEIRRSQARWRRERETRAQRNRILQKYPDVYDVEAEEKQWKRAVRKEKRAHAVVGPERLAARRAHKQHEQRAQSATALGALRAAAARSAKDDSEDVFAALRVLEEATGSRPGSWNHLWREEKEEVGGAFARSHERFEVTAQVGAEVLSSMQSAFAFD